MIKVNQFDDIAKDSLDEWIYYLKNNEFLDEFQAKGLAQAKEILKLDRLTEEERSLYIKHLENLSYKASMVKTWKIEEEDRIKRLRDIEIAKNLIKAGVDFELIKLGTGPSIEEIQNLRK